MGSGSAIGRRDPALLRRAAVIVASTAIYWSVAHLVWAGFSNFGMLPAPIWPSAAVALAAVLIFGPVAAAGIAAGTVLANWLSIGAPLPVALGIAVMNTAGPLIAAHLIQRTAKALPPFGTVRDVFVFIAFGVVLHAALTATGGVTSAVLGGRVLLDGAPDAWLRWWTAHASGTILFAPLILCWLPLRKSGLHGAQLAEAAAVSGVLVAGTGLLFTLPGLSAGMPFLLIVPLAWVSIRFRPRDVAAVVPLMAIIAAAGTILGKGPFAAAGSTAPLVSLGLMLLSFALTALILAALAEERRADIARRQRDEADLRLAASVYHNTIEGICITDPQGTILSVNPAFSEITGYSADEAVGQTPRILKSDHHDDAFYGALWAELKASGRWKGELWNRRKSGEVFLEHQTITMVPGPDGAPVRYVAVFNDITELHRKDERIRHLAYHDPLTGLPNRQLLQDRLEHALALARREGGRLAVMFLDLDRFKVINDTLGHDVGDNLLRVVAGRLAETVRTTDTVARLGGDEFVVVMEAPDTTAAIAGLAERIIRALAAPIDLGPHEVHVTTSIGISLYPGDGADLSSLMKNADTAMYAAKAAGRNAFHFFNASMNEKAQWRLELESEMRRAVERGEFELYYQPKIHMATGEVCGAEALMRWRHPTKGLISPADFIPMAEETGLVVAMGEWAILEACGQIARWRAQGLGDIHVAVNVSTRQLTTSGLFAIVAAALEVNEVPAHCLELEVTESAVMTNPEGAITMLRGLKDYGVALAIDDFGTGYSSLSYLRKLPIATLKIDRSFVIDIETNEQDAAIVRTILAMAESLDLNVVAEGVESASQVVFLAENGCTMAQGYYFSRPLPADAFAAWVTERRKPSADTKYGNMQVEYPII